MLGYASFSDAQQLGQESLQGNEQQLAQEMLKLITQVSLERDPSGPVKRLNQVKTQGCFNGSFTVRNDIPEHFKQGLFAHARRYPVYARFANASTMDDSEKDLRGLSLRVFDVQGLPVWGVQGRQDFLMNSYPVLFAQSPEVFYQFIQAQHDDGLVGFFLNPFDSHLKALRILLQARERPNSVFDIRYWSTTAYRLGRDELAVKYSVKPCSDYTSSEPNEYSADYLRQAMKKHLTKTPVCFEFMLQQQSDATAMPIEDATVEWDEEVSPFVTVADIEFTQQDFSSDEALSRCENASFNPWQSLAEHRPLGRINQVRKLIYQQMAALRRARSNL
ncbi:catalase family protein [Aliiglaciecola litoralis]|uniref:Catalase family protein n=2 Tax=Aliiglaciecola litoralis TaxID=582857 RepID=A0ABN1LCR6_9ALTE